MTDRPQTEPPPTRGALWRRPAMLAVALALATFILFAPTLRHDFVDYDDGIYVFGNTQVQAGFTWAGLKWAFTSGDASNWHPVTWLSHMLDVTVFGKAAGGHHFTSIVLHSLNAALVLLLLHRLTGRLWPSVIVAALFAFHPLHVESVAWVSERKDVLSGCFGLLSLLAYAGYVEQAKVRNPTSKALYAWSLVLFALGLMSKPMLVTLPFVMLLLDYWPFNRLSAAADQTSGQSSLPAGPGPMIWLEKLPFFALSAASCVVTFMVQKHGGAVSEALPASARIANALVSYVRYLRKTFWPDDLSVLYPHPGHWPAWQVAGTALVIGVLTIVAIGLWKRMPFVTVGWFWFIGMLVPVIGLVQVGIQSMADRYTYLPLLGVFVTLVWSADVMASRWVALKPWLGILAMLMIGACMWFTHHQVRIWENSETLFRNAIAVTRDNYLAQNNLGFYLAKKGRQAEAIQHYQIALRSSPDNLEVHNNLGNALTEVGQVDAAIVEYEFVLKRNPNHADARNNYGIALAMKGRLDDAMRQFKEALRLKPENASAHGNLGNAFAVQRRFREATEHYREALRLSPSDAQTRNNLGNVLAEQGRFDEAVTNYLLALELSPKNSETHFNLGCALARLGKIENAREQFRLALQLKPDHAAARRQLELLNSSAKP